MREITLEELLEVGCHFGHQVTRQNPKARDYIFEARDNIHIIDLAKTKEGLEQAGKFVLDLARRPESNLVIVGTKRQAKSIVEKELKRAAEELGVEKPSQIGLFSVANRWIGGTLTNFAEVAKNFKKLEELTNNLRDDELKSRYTKKEIGLWEKERVKLEGFYGGIMDLAAAPTVLFIIDTHLENLAVREALRTNAITIGITDTNADPYLIDYPIPANDDAVGSIELITTYIVDAWIEGRKNSELKESKETTEEKPKEPKKRGRKKKEKA